MGQLYSLLHQIHSLVLTLGNSHPISQTRNTHLSKSDFDDAIYHRGNIANSQSLLKYGVRYQSVGIFNEFEKVLAFWREDEGVVHKRPDTRAVSRCSPQLSAKNAN